MTNICPKHGKTLQKREWRGKLVEDNCPDCMADFVKLLGDRAHIERQAHD